MRRLKKFADFYRGEIVVCLMLVAALPWLFSK